MFASVEGVFLAFVTLAFVFVELLSLEVSLFDCYLKHFIRLLQLSIERFILLLHHLKLLGFVSKYFLLFL